MQKLLSIFLALAVVFSLAVPALAADSVDFVPQVDGEGAVVTKTVQTKDSSIRVTGISYPAQAQEVLRLTNKERAAQGLPALEWESTLVQPAILRALEQELSKSHTRPNGKEWHTVSIYANGENLAGGDITAADVMAGWMDSPSHKAAILDKDYSSMAVACVETETMCYWVQLFHSSKSANTPDKSAAPAATSGTTISSEFVAALSNANAGGTVVTATVRNIQAISPASAAEMVKWASARGKTAKLTANTTVTEGTAVQGQLSLNPASFTGMTADLKLGVYTESAKTAPIVEKVGKWYSNTVAVVKMDHVGTLPASVSIAAKVDLSGLNTASLVFYAYNGSANSISQIKSPACTIDKNGYLHFKTAQAGDIIISDRVLVKR